MQNSKAALRALYLKMREGVFAPNREEINRAIAAQVLCSQAFMGAQTVFVYVSTEQEIGTKTIIDDAFAGGKTVCVPRCSANGVMTARRIASWDDLHTRGAFGILEPDEHTPVIPPAEIDLAIIPSLACDRQGYRLGYGGGYYDRFLPQTAAIKVALCAHNRLVDSLPHETHDVRCQIIVTEKELLRV